VFACCCCSGGERGDVGARGGSRGGLTDRIGVLVDCRLVTFTPFPRDAILLAIVYLNRITHLPYTTGSIDVVVARLF
jgi:hypothetical protein